MLRPDAKRLSNRILRWILSVVTIRGQCRRAWAASGNRTQLPTLAGVQVTTAQLLSRYMHFM